MQHLPKFAFLSVLVSHGRQASLNTQIGSERIYLIASNLYIAYCAIIQAIKSSISRAFMTIFILDGMWLTRPASKCKLLIICSAVFLWGVQVATFPLMVPLPHHILIHNELWPDIYKTDRQGTRYCQHISDIQNKQHQQACPQCTEEITGGPARSLVGLQSECIMCLNVGRLQRQQTLQSN